MAQIGAFEAKNTLGALLDRVEGGEEIVITRHGKPVARLVPNTGKIDQSQALAALQRIRARACELPAANFNSKKSKRTKFDWESVKDLRDEGRR